MQENHRQHRAVLVLGDHSSFCIECTIFELQSPKRLPAQKKQSLYELRKVLREPSADRLDGAASDYLQSALLEVALNAVEPLAMDLLMECIIRYPSEALIVAVTKLICETIADRHRLYVLVRVLEAQQLFLLLPKMSPTIQLKAIEKLCVAYSCLEADDRLACLGVIHQLIVNAKPGSCVGIRSLIVQLLDDAARTPSHEFHGRCLDLVHFGVQTGIAVITEENIVSLLKVTLLSPSPAVALSAAQFAAFCLGHQPGFIKLVLRSDLPAFFIESLEASTSPRQLQAVLDAMILLIDSSEFAHHVALSLPVVSRKLATVLDQPNDPATRGLLLVYGRLLEFPDAELDPSLLAVLQRVFSVAHGDADVPLVALGVLEVAFQRAPLKLTESYGFWPLVEKLTITLSTLPSATAFEKGYLQALLIFLTHVMNVAPQPNPVEGYVMSQLLPFWLLHWRKLIQYPAEFSLSTRIVSHAVQTTRNEQAASRLLSSRFLSLYFEIRSHFPSEFEAASPLNELLQRVLRFVGVLDEEDMPAWQEAVQWLPCNPRQAAELLAADSTPASLSSVVLLIFATSLQCGDCLLAEKELLLACLQLLARSSQLIYLGSLSVLRLITIVFRCFDVCESDPDAQLGAFLCTVLEALPISLFVRQLEAGDTLVLSWCLRQPALWSFAEQLLAEWCCCPSFLPSPITAQALSALLRSAPGLASMLSGLLAHSDALVQEAVVAVLIRALTSDAEEVVVGRAVLENGFWAAVHRQSLHFPHSFSRLQLVSLMLRLMRKLSVSLTSYPTVEFILRGAVQIALSDAIAMSPSDSLHLLNACSLFAASRIAENAQWDAHWMKAFAMQWIVSDEVSAPLPRERRRARSAALHLLSLFGRLHWSAEVNVVALVETLAQLARSDDLLCRVLACKTLQAQSLVLASEAVCERLLCPLLNDILHTDNVLAQTAVKVFCEVLECSPSSSGCSIASSVRSTWCRFVAESALERILANDQVTVALWEFLIRTVDMNADWIASVFSAGNVHRLLLAGNQLEGDTDSIAHAGPLVQKLCAANLVPESAQATAQQVTLRSQAYASLLAEPTGNAWQ